MEHVQFVCTQETFRPFHRLPVRWLSREDDYPLVLAFWPAHTPISCDDWNNLYARGHSYCASIHGATIRSMAGVWRYSDHAWEVVGVNTDPAFRNHGYGKAVVSFITAYILANGRRAICKTRANNIAMIKTATGVGFQRSD